MADLDLNELERLEKAATPGPWKWDSDQIKDDPMNRCRYRVCVVGKTVMQTYYSSDDVHAEADATLTCALRNALPELLRRLREAEEILSWLESQHVEVRRPAMYGSFLAFKAFSQEGPEGCGDTPSDLRAKVRAAIDAARRKP